MTVVIIGGTVLDVQARALDVELLRGSSVPGKVSQVAGGVGRNIAEAAHQMLQDKDRQQQQQLQAVHLISVLGRDAAADALLASFTHLGMDTSYIIQSSSCSTPCVVTLLDRTGEVAASVADVAAAELITPAVVLQHKSVIHRAQLLILDANFDAPTLAAAAQLAAAAGVPVLYEPVSVPKSIRCLSVLRQLTYITPNANELLAIAAAVQLQVGRLPLHTPASLAANSPQQVLAQLSHAAAVVLQEGVHYIILTLGPLGAALLTLQHQHTSQHISQHITSHKTMDNYNPNSQQACRHLLVAQHIPAAPATVKNLSGAGDTLTGAFAAALVRGASSTVEALAVGVAAAKVSVECKDNVPGPADGLGYEKLWGQAQELLGKMQTWHFPVSAAL